jgi:hypothetical protein
MVPKTKESNLLCVSVEGMSQFSYNTNMGVIFGVHIPLWGWGYLYQVTDFHLLSPADLCLPKMCRNHLTTESCNRWACAGLR